MLERAALELAPFLDEVAFVGGATVALWLTDPAGPKPRVTKDVDVVVEVATRVAWYRFEERLRAHGLRNDTSSPVICRWRAGSPGDELVEAWNGRGGGDHLRSHDLEDIITLIDGRGEVAGEVEDAPGDLREFLSREIATLLDQPRFLDTIDGTVVGFGGDGPGSGSGDADRVNEVFLPRIRALAGQ